MFRFAISIVTLCFSLSQLLVVFSSASRPVIEAFQLVDGKLFSVKAPQDILEVKCSMVIVNQHHRRQVVVSIEVFERVLKNRIVLSTGQRVTYLCNPFEWLC